MSEQATKTKEATPSKKVQEPHILAAVDDGYAQMKIAFGDPESDVPPTLDSVRSSASYGSLGSLSGGAVGAYETDGGKVTMTVSDEIRGEATNFDGFHTSPLNRILMAHTLISVGLGGKKVDLWAALPVKDFFLSQSALNKELIDKKKENLREPVISLVHGVECAEYGSINRCPTVWLRLQDGLAPRRLLVRLLMSFLLVTGARKSAPREPEKGFLRVKQRAHHDRTSAPPCFVFGS